MLSYFVQMCPTVYFYVSTTSHAAIIMLPHDKLVPPIDWLKATVKSDQSWVKVKLCDNPVIA
jgi:hypothetical protein